MATKNPISRSKGTPLTPAEDVTSSANALPGQAEAIPAAPPTRDDLLHALGIDPATQTIAEIAAQLGIEITPPPVLAVSHLGPPAVEWTHAAPLTEGWYWSVNAARYVRPLRVFESQGRLLVEYVGRDVPVPEFSTEATWWAGPFEVPALPEG